MRVYQWVCELVVTGSRYRWWAAGDWFGNAVSINANGERVVVGGLYNEAAGDEAGHVRVHEWNGIMGAIG